MKKLTTNYRHLLSWKRRRIFCLISMSKSSQPTTSTTQRHTPVAGVLCTDIMSEIRDAFGADLYSYIATSYVKFLESAGAKVVPIWIGRERGYYEHIMSKVNGILLPGGAVYVSNEDAPINMPIPTHLTNDCVQSAKFIYDIAMAKNNRGDSFPLWGTCLGFQLMFIHAANNENLREPCTPLTRAMHLHLTDDYRDSYLFKKLPKDYEEALHTEAFAIHNHRYCITMTAMSTFMRHEDWHVLATNRDDNGLEFVSLVEHISYPFFGSQVHFERVAFEHLDPEENKMKNPEQCIEVAQYFGRMFVDACRNSPNRFTSAMEEQRHLISNFPMTYTGDKEKIRIVSGYLFKRDVDYPKA